jgi:hypothetical protein
MHIWQRSLKRIRISEYDLFQEFAMNSADVTALKAHVAINQRRNED